MTSSPLSFEGIDVRRSAKTNATIAQKLATQIISSKAQPGTALPSERELAESLGVGRGTMREALRLLETFGLIEMRTGRYGGPVVKLPDAHDLSISLTLAFYANGSSMLDVLEARLVMEPALAELAAERITPEQLAALRETIAVTREESDSESAYLAAAERFHNLVAEASESPVLSHLSAGLQHIAGGESVGITYSRGVRLAVARSHELIADALEDRDGEAARTLWRSHLMEAAEYWRRRFPKQAAEPVGWTLGLERQ